LQRALRNIITICLISLIFLLAWKIPANVEAGVFDDGKLLWLLPPDTTESGDTSVVLPFPAPKQDEYLLYTVAFICGRLKI
jgi:hypothetical protein